MENLIDIVTRDPNVVETMYTKDVTDKAGKLLDRVLEDKDLANKAKDTGLLGKIRDFWEKYG